jgi:Domain of unknown function (DUF4253)
VAVNVRHPKPYGKADSPGGYTRAMDADHLPAGLPPGRLMVPNLRFGPRWTGGPVYWVSQPLPDAPQQWARLQAIQNRTGLRPLLLGGADDQLEPCDAGAIDALDAETILLREWRALARLRQQGLYDAAYHREVMAGIPEDVDIVPFPYDPGPPFVTWPSLAPPGAAGRDPDVVAREVVASKVLARMLPVFAQQVYLGLVPAVRSADVPARMGSSVATNYLGVAELSAVLRSWEERFGARVVAITDGLYVSVAAPPLTWEHAEQLALEHYLLCTETVGDEGGGTFPGYVGRILGADLWRFWWD